MIIAKSIAARAVVCLVSLAVVLSTVLLWRERRVHADSTRVRFCEYGDHGESITKFATVFVPNFDPVFDLRHVQTIGLLKTNGMTEPNKWKQMETFAESCPGGAIVYVQCYDGYDGTHPLTEARFTFNEND